LTCPWPLRPKCLEPFKKVKLPAYGGDKEIKVDVRIVAATNKNLLEEIEKGNFRMDLYHRLSVILIHVPTLNERAEDIPMIADKFLGEICEENAMQPKKFTARWLQSTSRCELDR